MLRGDDGQFLSLSENFSAPLVGVFRRVDREKGWHRIRDASRFTVPVIACDCALLLLFFVD